jgi:hypothetical protein
MSTALAWAILGAGVTGRAIGCVCAGGEICGGPAGVCAIGLIADAACATAETAEAIVLCVLPELLELLELLFELLELLALELLGLDELTELLEPLQQCEPPERQPEPPCMLCPQPSNAAAKTSATDCIPANIGWGRIIAAPSRFLARVE